MPLYEAVVANLTSKRAITSCAARSNLPSSAYTSLYSYKVTPPMRRIECIFSAHNGPIITGIRLTIQPVSRKCWLGEHALFEGGGVHCRGGGVRIVLSVVR